VQVNICSSLCSFIATSDADIEQIFSFKYWLVVENMECVQYYMTSTLKN
jgi:hypothetical protein